VRLSFRQITDKVEYYWITRSAHDASDFSLWTFNGKTLKVSHWQLGLAPYLFDSGDLTDIYIYIYIYIIGFT